MSSLPPYSTFRTDNKQMMYPQAVSHGNILTFTPKGFPQTLNVKFPDSRLAVCEKCKKNYKTRDMCRVRNNHTGPPWTTAYICITLDASCTDEDGKFIDKPMTVRMVQWQPFCVKEPFEKKTPVCSSCKKTNRTRSFCRDRHQHRHLPWCTVYVMLSALESTDPSTVVAAPSKPAEGKDEEKIAVKMASTDTSKSTGAEGGTEGKQSDEKKAVETFTKAGSEIDGAATEKPDKLSNTAKDEPSPKEKKTSGEGEGDDVNNIDESRTFLAKVSCRSNSIHWLELAEYDPSNSAAMNPESHVQALNAAIRSPIPMDPSQYYAQMAAMGYTPQQMQSIMMQNQQFYQMQQQHQQAYAAQHAAWQAQYNQHMQAQMAGQPQQGVPPVPGSVPQPAQVAGVPGSAPQASPVVAIPGAPGTEVQPPQQGAANGCVTAGEAAAAKQQEQKQNGATGDLLATQSIPAPTAGAAAAAQAQAQAQAQWQAQMMYQQQLYQQQLQMQQTAQGMVEPQPAGAAQEQVEKQQQDTSSEPPSGGEEGKESDAKRPRIDAV